MVLDIKCKMKTSITIYSLSFLLILKLIDIASLQSIDNGSTLLTIPITKSNNESSCERDCLDKNLSDELRESDCPALNSQILVNFLPNGTNVLSLTNENGVLRTLSSVVSTLDDCVKICCSSSVCNFAIMINNTCNLFFCSRDISCIPVPFVSNTSKFSQNNVKMTNESQILTILVRPPLPLFKMSSSCEVGIGVGECLINEKCVPKNSRSRNGRCSCDIDNKYIMSSRGSCEIIPEVEELEKFKQVKKEFVMSSTSPKPPKILEVSVSSKNITLPENEATLFAYAVPQAPQDSPYSYEWILISHPENDPATIEGQTRANLHLTHLVQGTYTFQVKVKGPESTGSVNTSLTVFSPKRINQAPIAHISPPFQTIQLPTNSAILDGTSSTDDDKLVNFKWELQKGPINYSFSSPDKNYTTLQINDLVPGNYTFKLVVEDGDGVRNSTTADVVVIKEIDYPPTANAGKDIVIYLPQTSVTLNGNSSSDDKGIVEWEWKATGDAKKAVDMQDSHSPYLKLSGLEEGLYTFELTVTDEGKQVSNPSTVHLFVKNATGNPPIANGGGDQTISLPQSWVVLDGGGSKGDSKIIKYNWTMLSGPSSPLFNNSNEKLVNVTNLTKGIYEFSLTVEDEAKLTANTTVKVTVNQKTNEGPKANGGGDLKLALPLSIVLLNGSNSWDDVGIKSWKWERESNSLAAGTILQNTDTTPILKLIGLVPGKYSFKLTVKDEQGLSDENSVTLIVNEDPNEKNLIELVLNTKLSDLLESDKIKFLNELSLLTHDTNLIIYKIIPQLHSGLTKLLLYGTKNEETLGAETLYLDLKDKLKKGGSLLSYKVESVDTLQCLDKCSSHGACVDKGEIRECVCDPFWMENYIRKHFGDGDRNCEWSKIYVGLIVCLLLFLNLSIIWSLVYLFHRSIRNFKGDDSNSYSNSNGKYDEIGSRRNGSLKRAQNLTHHKKKQYTLVNNDEDEEEIELEIRGDEVESDDESNSGEESLIYERTHHLTTNLLPKIKQNTTESNGNSSRNLNGILKKTFTRPGIRA